MTFFSALKLLVASAPALLKLVIELAEWLKANFGDDPARAIEEHAAAIKLVKEAKTPDEKARAAAALSALLRKL